MGFHVIIPARWSSTRLPGKMLADLHGQALVVHTAMRASQSSASSVAIATDHEPIASCVRQAGYTAVMTDQNHQSGTDRLAQAADLLGLEGQDIDLNVQGDEPLIDPALIDSLAQCLADTPDAVMATAACRIDPAAAQNPNVVKVVLDLTGCALYFSRSPIPFYRNAVDSLDILHHIGIYAYRVEFLQRFPNLSQGLLERAESLEQLRALEHGHKIKVLVTERAHFAGVDTQADLDAVRAHLAGRSKG